MRKQVHQSPRKQQQLRLIRRALDNMFHRERQHRKHSRRRSRSIFGYLCLVLLLVIGAFRVRKAEAYIVQQQQHHFTEAPFRSRPLVDQATGSGTTAKQYPTKCEAKLPVITSVLPLSVTQQLSPLENWCLTRLDNWYRQSQSLKCPFMRRRSGDILDALETMTKHLVVRKGCWPLMEPPQAHRPAGTNKKTNVIKYKELSPDEIHKHILKDWKPETDGKGYYITGKLTTQLYQDDCLFLGPDPDLPIHGLRKYVGVASHLFDYDTSSATLHSLEMVQDDQNNTEKKFVAKWTMSGILRLPWRPALPTFSGETIYHIDKEGLICCHEESWDCSALRAFCYTLLPQFSNIIWTHNSA